MGPPGDYSAIISHWGTRHRMSEITSDTNTGTGNPRGDSERKVVGFDGSDTVDDFRFGDLQSETDLDPYYCYVRV